jgi:hypothetical protein
MMVPPPADDVLPACKRTVPVANSAALVAALSAAQPGDCLNLADGDYTFPMITAKGTAAAPIVIKATTVLKAVVSTGDLTLRGAAYVVVQGIMWSGSGIITLTDADHCRISRFRIQRMETGPNQQLHDLVAITLAGKSSDCRFDHNDIGPQGQRGNMILATGDENAGTLSQRTRIDHNYFHDVHYTGGNGWETIRSGADTLSFVSSFNIIEHNLFKNDANDPEVISVKSSDNTIRYNTLRSSRGQFVLRSGNRDIVYGNYILADGEPMSLGLRVHGGQHKIFNNYVEGVGGPGILMEGGENNDMNGTLQDHKQVRQGRQFSGCGHLQRHALRDQGERQQRHQHRLPGGKRRHAAHHRGCRHHEHRHPARVPHRARRNAGAMNPFGLWFAGASTLYVADEGDGKVANATTNVNAGLQKWVLRHRRLHDARLDGFLDARGSNYRMAGMPASAI